MLESVRLALEDSQHAEGKLQEARAIRQQNIHNLERVAKAAERLQSKFTKQEIDSHQERKVKLEELSAAQSLAELFGRFCTIMQADSVEQLRELNEVIYRMTCTSNAHKQDIVAALVGRLQQFKKEFDRNHLSELESCFERNHLPLKKEVSVQKILEGPDERLLRNYVGVETKLAEAFKLLNRPYECAMLRCLFRKPMEAVQYHFLDRASELYRVHEPNWMLNYIKDAVEGNVNFLVRQLTPSKQECTFMIAESFELLVKRSIVERLRLDMPSFEQSGQLLFSFVESIIILEQNLNSRYELLAERQQQSLLELLVCNFEKEKLLEKLMGFEQSCFESRVFRDFVHIDYSRINLKNVEAYNITQNFNLVFDKLYCKYLSTSKDTLAKVNSVYQSILDKMVRHVKTAFDRIYNNNSEKYAHALFRFQILVVFRRIEDELRGNMGKYRQHLSDLERILQLLTTDLQKAFVQFAETTLQPLNKKISKTIIDCPLENGKFSSTEVDTHTINALQREWKVALDRLNEIYFYRDPPLTRMIFMLLQKMEFTKQGLAAFISAFQPFLKQIFTSEQARLIKSMVFMEKNKLADVTRDRSNIIRSFLSQQQIEIIERLDYTL